MTVLSAYAVSIEMSTENLALKKNIFEFENLTKAFKKNLKNYQSR